MNCIIHKGSILSVAAFALLVSGCASMDDVKHAQATADQALTTAQEAKQMAADAQNTAHSAQQSVDQLRSQSTTGSETTTTTHKGERG